MSPLAVTLCVNLRPQAHISGSLALALSPTVRLLLPQVSVGELPLYLLGLKEAGYRVVGVEQTGSSQMLQDFRFTRRTALVLGAEKEGLPASLLALMDDCVEIPQLGLVRSLNVHVTGAMVVWEYTKQQALAG